VVFGTDFMTDVHTRVNLFMRADMRPALRIAQRGTPQRNLSCACIQTHSSMVRD